jgi:Rhodanese-like domain
MVYQTPEQRLEADLSQLIAVPAFQSLPVEMIDLTEFKAAIDTRQARILDARSSVYDRQGHVPGALNLARDNFGANYCTSRTVLKHLGQFLVPTSSYIGHGKVDNFHVISMRYFAVVCSSAYVLC